MARWIAANFLIESNGDDNFFFSVTTLRTTITFCIRRDGCEALMCVTQQQQQICSDDGIRTTLYNFMNIMIHAIIEPRQIKANRQFEQQQIQKIDVRSAQRRRYKLWAIVRKNEQIRGGKLHSFTQIFVVNNLNECTNSRWQSDIVAWEALAVPLDERLPLFILSHSERFFFYISIAGKTVFWFFHFGCSV